MTHRVEGANSVACFTYNTLIIYQSVELQEAHSVLGKSVLLVTKITYVKFYIFNYAWFNEAPVFCNLHVYTLLKLKEYACAYVEIAHRGIPNISKKPNGIHMSYTLNNRLLCLEKLIYNVFITCIVAEK